MIAFLSQNAISLLTGLCLVLAAAGLFFRPDSGAESFPLMYPLLALVVISALVITVRLLATVLRMKEGDDHAD